MVGNSAENTYTDDSLLSKLDQKLTKLEDFLSFAAALVILGLMVFGTMNVIGRKVFQNPIWGYNDIVTLGMVAFSFLAISAMQRVGGHIRMELVVRQMKGRVLWVAEFIGVAIAIFIMVVLVYFSFDAFVRSIELGDSTMDRELLTWPSKFWVPFAFAVLVLRLILQAWGYARLIAAPDAQPVAVPVMAEISELAEKQIADTFGDDEAAHSLDALDGKEKADG